MSLAQVNHICIYLYIMFRHSLSAHTSHSLLVHTHVLILSHRDSGIDGFYMSVHSLSAHSLSAPFILQARTGRVYRDVITCYGCIC